MNFREAFKLLKQGEKVKLPSWAGYWKYESNTIMMYCKDGKILDIRETDDVEYTFNNIASDEWELAGESNTLMLNGEQNFSFSEALKQLKSGRKVARKGWNGKGLYVQMNKGGDFEFSELLPFFVIKNILNSFNTWVPSVSDILAEDWEVVNCE